MAKFKQNNLDLGANHYIVVNPVPSADVTGTGIKGTMTVDANATGVGAALHIDADGNFIEADATASGTMPCQAIALEAGTGSKEVMFVGFMRDDSWSWTPGGELYVSETGGALVQTAPSTASACVQVVGIATHADRIFFNPAYGYVEVAA